MILTLVRAKKASPGKDEVVRFCRSIQLISSRDIDGTITTVVRAMLEESSGKPVGSTELAQSTRLNRVTIIHHLQRLEKMGIVEHEQHKYRLSPMGFSDLVQKMRQRQEQMLGEAESLAQRIENEYFSEIENSGQEKYLLENAEEKKSRKKK